MQCHYSRRIARLAVAVRPLPKQTHRDHIRRNTGWPSRSTSRIGTPSSETHGIVVIGQPIIASPLVVRPPVRRPASSAVIWPLGEG